MKTRSKTFQTRLAKIIFGGLSALMLLNLGARAADAAAASAASGGIADTEIRAVIDRVAKHQIRQLKDGEYTSVAITNALQLAQAAAPEGIAWSYPWGVTLYGMLRSTDVTGDKEVEKFVLDHNLVCARDYVWLTNLREHLGASPALTALYGKAKIKGLLNLGSLDSCGAMGNQILEGMIRHPDQMTPEENAVVARIADWIVNKQDRMPDGTLWRSKSMNGTLWPDDLYMGGVFLVRWGIYTHDEKFIDDAASQIIHQLSLIHI